MRPEEPVPVRVRTALPALAVVLMALTSGCVPQGLAFRVDDRLTILSPKARSEVTLPVTVRWSVRDFAVIPPASTESAGSDSGYFGVFLDRPPQPPGKPLAWVARDDRGCRPADGCPDAEYLADRNIYSTTATEIVFRQLPRPSSKKGKERHQVTIVLLDADGRRIGESAFHVDFTLNRKGSS
jgi:hypothetical protein